MSDPIERQYRTPDQQRAVVRAAEELRRQGLTQRAIAKQLGLQPRRLQEYLQRYRAEIEAGMAAAEATSRGVTAELAFVQAAQTAQGAAAEAATLLAEVVAELNRRLEARDKRSNAAKRGDRKRRALAAAQTS